MKTSDPSLSDFQFWSDGCTYGGDGCEVVVPQKSTYVLAESPKRFLADSVKIWVPYYDVDEGINLLPKSYCNTIFIYFCTYPENLEYRISMMILIIKGTCMHVTMSALYWQKLQTLANPCSDSRQTKRKWTGFLVWYFLFRLLGFFCLCGKIKIGIRAILSEAKACMEWERGWFSLEFVVLMRRLSSSVALVNST